ncbi:hypothetical protein M427DRAFT_52256 [Gonapodya prolifera JEL478]|uniref:Pkr1-domain-containing protein n=1 Tax=Gonapodya prolifera (strain JEL478) TaxID=1344416 RepID=A0A139AVE5_GONPJ|nr:hypothetical protein M427DRAFT_52256 [Gonapodya prolifera JEL478]|eukprot:KXS20669.1 hypothetical protein M427DRAFT_52256 [Gonapodya prolifera JEL478]
MTTEFYDDDGASEVPRESVQGEQDDIKDTLLALGGTGLLRRALHVGQESDRASTTLPNVNGDGDGEEVEEELIHESSGLQEAREEPGGQKNVTLIEDVWLSVFTPGVPNQRVQAVFQFIFLLMMLSLFGLWWASEWSIHVAVLVFAGAGLWASTTWFLNELQNTPPEVHPSKKEE